MDGQADKVFPLKPLYQSQTQQRAELAWLLNKEDNFALLLFRNARNAAVSPNGRWVAYENHIAFPAGRHTYSITNLYLARIQEVPQRSYEFVLNKGSRDGLKKGMILDVFRNEDWQGFPPIGSVQVVQVFSHHANVRTIIETHHSREAHHESSYFEKPVEAGDRVLIPGPRGELAFLNPTTPSSPPQVESK